MAKGGNDNDDFAFTEDDLRNWHDATRGLQKLKSTRKKIELNKKTANINDTSSHKSNNKSSNIINPDNHGWSVRQTSYNDEGGFSLPHSKSPKGIAKLKPNKALSCNQPQGIDRNSDKRLKSGSYPIDAALDLHGMTKSRAYKSLYGFIESSYNGGLRCLLVITGKGLHSRRDFDSATLKQEVPKWLCEPVLSSRIIKFTHAAKKHGGDGALYVLLKRQR